MGDRLEQALAEADEIEALEGEAHLEVTATATGEGHVSRPNRARSKVLHVRLSPEEFEAVERVAAARGLPASTVARDRLLAMVAEDSAESGDVGAELVAVVEQLQRIVGRVPRRVAARSTSTQFSSPV